MQVKDVVNKGASSPDSMQSLKGAVKEEEELEDDEYIEEEIVDESEELISEEEDEEELEGEESEEGDEEDECRDDQGDDASTDQRFQTQTSSNPLDHQRVSEEVQCHRVEPGPGGVGHASPQIELEQGLLGEVRCPFRIAGDSVHEPKDPRELLFEEIPELLPERPGWTAHPGRPSHIKSSSWADGPGSFI